MDESVWLKIGSTQKIMLGLVYHNPSLSSDSFLFIIETFNLLNGLCMDSAGVYWADTQKFCLQQSNYVNHCAKVRQNSNWTLRMILIKSFSASWLRPRILGPEIHPIPSWPCSPHPTYLTYSWNFWPHSYSHLRRCQWLHPVPIYQSTVSAPENWPQFYEHRRFH